MVQTVPNFYVLANLDNYQKYFYNNTLSIVFSGDISLH